MTLPNGHDRSSGDWITDFLTSVSTVSAPYIFKKWSAITLIGATIQRRSWIKVKGKPLYPNLYVFLVGKPAQGKGEAIGPVFDYARETRNGKNERIIKCAADNMTKSAFIDSLARAAFRDISPSGQVIEYNSLFLCCTEFSELMPVIDSGFMHSLSKLWDNEKFYDEARRSRKVQELTITSPNVSILAATQPAHLGQFPADIWNKGFCSRTIFIFSDEEIDSPFFPPEVDFSDLDLGGRLAQIHNHYGFVDFSREGAILLENTRRQGIPPKPTHPRLASYVGRRPAIFGKLSLISARSRARGQVEVDDVSRAHDWMKEAEEPMADIFDKMTTSTDAFFLEEARIYFEKLYKAKGMLVREEVRQYIDSKVEFNKAKQALEALVESRILTTPDNYFYAPGGLHGKKN